MIGQTLAHYKILEKIGSGGMGDVYLAEDTKLDRKVALKVLPPELAENEERRARFQREAKALAALDHPNIVHVYSVEEADGVHFITMQLVHGKTLTELLPKNGFPLNKFFEIAIPLADAVAAAHQEGITHRDLKPDNMMVGEDGRIKVLDFGLAKPTSGFVGGDANSALPTAAKTAEGVIVGTLNYMSPEQAEGKTVDQRSDIFSIGIILYEMVTGQRPFQGDTPTSVLSSILKDTPRDVTEINPALPNLLGRTIRRCLAKDTSRRYQSALDMRNELEELQQDVQSGAVARGAVSSRVEERRRSWSWWLAGIAAVFVVAWVAGLIPGLVEESVRSAVPRLTHPVQVTSAIGLEEHPSWSPNGRALAYHSDQGGNWDIWISQIDGGQPLNRTADKGRDQYPSWSPDGSQIAFFSDRGGGGIFVMPVFAGPPRRISQPGTLARGRPQWSSDGAELAYEVRESGQSFAEITSLATSESRRIELPGVHLMRPHLSWSPRGRFFAYLDVDRPGNNINQLMLLSVADGGSFPITTGDTHELAPSWSRDERALYFVSTRGGASDVWLQGFREDGQPEGDPQPVTAGLEVQSLALSLDGTRLAYSKGRNVANVWRVPILGDRLATWSDAEQLTFDQASAGYVDVSPDGKRLVLATDRSGSADVWILSLESGELRQLTTDPHLESGPAWSPDGTQVAFHSNRSGTRDIWVKNVDGGPARQLTEHESEDYNPAWSPDGRSIVFGSTRIGGVTIWTISAGGGSPTKLVDAMDVNSPHWSPDGEWLAFPSDGAHVSPRIWLMHRSKTKPELLTTGRRRPRWSLDGQQLFFMRDVDAVGPDLPALSDLWAVDFGTRVERQLTDLSGRWGRLHRFATDGSYLYFIWGEDIGDIWVMDVVTE